MAKRLLLQILVDNLGKFVEGLTEENLKVGVWSGKIELRNLQLKTSALEDLDLPVEVVHGTLRMLTILIPWVSLHSKPVKVMIDGVVLQAAPLDVNSMGKNDLKTKIFNTKRRRLLLADSVVSVKSKEEDSEEDKKRNSSSYIQRLTARILDNLEVTIRNIHIRYEDSMTIPGTTFAAGMTLDKFTIATTNDQWTETFISRDEKKTESVMIHKLIRIDNVAVYWNTVSIPLRLLPALHWDRAMQSILYTNENRAPLASATPAPVSSQSYQDVDSSDRSAENSGQMYILVPPNRLQLKMIHCENGSETDPKLDLTIEGLHLELKLDRTQLIQVKQTAFMFGVLERQKIVALYRPADSALQDPKAWWKYAYMLVRGKGKSQYPSKVAEVLACFKARPTYITLVKRSKAVGLTADETAGLDAALIEIEERLPINALLIFRKIALSELAKEQAIAKKDTSTSSASGFFTKKTTGALDSEHGPSSGSQDLRRALNSKSSWFSWGKKKEGVGDKFRPKAKVDEGDVPLEDVEEALERGLLDDVSKEEYSLRLRMPHGKVTFELSSERAPVIFALLEMSIATDIRTSSVSGYFSIDHAVIADRHTLRPIIPYILAPPFDEHSSVGAGSVSGSQSPSRYKDRLDPIRSSPLRRPVAGLAVSDKFMVKFNTRGGTTDVAISAFPLEICLNKDCIQRLLYVIGGDSEQHQKEIEVVNRKSRLARLAQQYIDKKAAPTGSVNITLEMKAPLIMLPESCTLQKGCALVDMGNLVMTIVMDGSGLDLKANMTDIRAGLPHSVSFMRDFAAKGHELVRPFAIALTVQNQNTMQADMTITLDIHPEIRGVLDGDKLARLLRIVDVAVEMFSPPPAVTGPGVRVRSKATTHKKATQLLTDSLEAGGLSEYNSPDLLLPLALLTSDQCEQGDDEYELTGVKVKLPVLGSSSGGTDIDSGIGEMSMLI